MSAAAMKPSEALRKARELITPEGAWIKGDLARTADGYSCGPLSPDAVCLCSEGSLYLAVGQLPWQYNHRADLAMDYLRKVIGTKFIHQWQDLPDRTHTEVLEAFDRAIALAEAEGC